MKILVLLSGGVDSSTCLGLAESRVGSKNVSALSLHYGQRHDREIRAAKKVAEYYGVKQLESDLSAPFMFSDCSLLVKNANTIVHESYREQLAKMGGSGTVSTYVPFRNGLFLSFAAAIAISLGAEQIYYGAHGDDAVGRAYPDCTPEFYDAMNQAVYEGSGYTCRLEAPLLNMTKTDVVKTGLELKVPYQYTWSCYEGGEQPCGTCATCLDRAKAFRENGVKDPAL